MKTFLRMIYENSTTLGIDPILLIRRWQGLPIFFKNLRIYNKRQRDDRFPVKWHNFYYTSYDRYQAAGYVLGHYFWQDLWAARNIYEKKIVEHIDVGSRIDGFIAHIVPFCKVTYIDLRPIRLKLKNLTFVRSSILNLPFKSNSAGSLSCLHVFEHIGLGRYGDPVDPDAYLSAARELLRILSIGGTLQIGTPVGKECLRFDAHRIFDPQTVVEIFAPLSLNEFSLVDDSGSLIEKATFGMARKCDYGCGLFVFIKD
jgi:hypothetical protein